MTPRAMRGKRAGFGVARINPTALIVAIPAPAVFSPSAKRTQKQNSSSQPGAGGFANSTRGCVRELWAFLDNSIAGTNRLFLYSERCFQLGDPCPERLQGRFDFDGRESWRDILRAIPIKAHYVHPNKPLD
jgi:hypothetical protein